MKARLMAALGLFCGLVTLAPADETRVPALKVSGLKTYRTVAIVSTAPVTLTQFQPAPIQDSFAKVKCKSGASRCIIKIEIEASLSGTADFPFSICPMVDGNPVQSACADNGQFSASGVRHSVLALVSRKAGTSHQVGFRVFSSAATSSLEKFSAAYTTFYR